MNYVPDAAICPRCGSPMDVRSVQELFSMLGGMQSPAMQPAGQPGPSGMGSWPGQAYPQQAYPQSGYGMQPAEYYDPDQSIADGVMSVAGGMLGGLLRRRMQRHVEQRVIPAMEASQEQARQRWAQSSSDQAAIVERYPELRCCMRDQVVFLAGGTASVPTSDLSLPITLAQADQVVSRLRAS